LHRLPVFAGLGYAEGSLPESERASREVLSLPMHPALTDEQIGYVAELIAAVAETHAATAAYGRGFTSSVRVSSFVFTAPVRLPQVGVGYWGRILLRCAVELPGAEVVWACDQRDGARAHAARQYPSVQTTDRYEDLLEDESVEAILVATETPQHFPLAEAALR